MVKKISKRKNIRHVQVSKVNIVTDKIFYSKRSETDSTGKLINYGGVVQAANGLFVEYFSQSSIHGFNYIGDQKRSVLERIIWLFAVILSILACCFLMTNIWNKRNSNPVIITFNENLTPVWEIPFPSVTICPETKTHTDIFNFTNIYEKIKSKEYITEKEKYYLEAIAQICDPISTLLHGNYIATATNLISALLHAAPTLNETFFQCGFRNELQMKCNKNFNQILTNDGICFNFNSFKPRQYIKDEYLKIINNNDSKNLEWNLEDGYKLEANNDAFPARVIGSGKKERLMVVLGDRIRNSDLLCRSASHGYKVFFNTPGEMPYVTDRYLVVPHQQEASILIRPKIVISDIGLRQYDPERRRCYYQDERFLRYFKFYTQPNCELECLSNHTLEKCGCVKFSMPRNSSHAVCGSKSMICLYDVETMLFEIKFEQRSQTNRLDDSKNCNCLPSCINVKYKTEFEHQAAFDYTSIYRHFFKKDLLQEHPGIQFTKIKIYFKEEAFNALKRSELYSTTDFLSNCGGLLGLFMGVSILSLVELVYFFTIRLLMTLKMKWRKRQQIMVFEGYTTEEQNQRATKFLSRHFTRPQ